MRCGLWGRLGLILRVGGRRGIGRIKGCCKN
jgi:hypothetical protein